MRFKKALTTLISSLALLMPVEAAVAAPSSYSQGIDLYGQGQYGKALPFLQAAVKTGNGDASSHYYLALCLLALKQKSAAREQFDWVAKNSADPTLSQSAAAALNSIQVATPVAATNSAASPPGTTDSQWDVQTPAKPTAEVYDYAPSSAAPGHQIQHVLTASHNGHNKALMFETSWCHYCHQFAPHFDAVAAQNRSYMDFQRLDAEAPANAGLREKYNIHSYPRLVYLDSSGKVLYNEGRSAFDQRVRELSAAK